MGDRAQIAIKQHDGSKVYLYSHWDGADTRKALARALQRKQRWNDPEHLTRIIFCEMVKGQENEETGYGIGTTLHDDTEHPVPVLDCKSRTIEWENGDIGSGIFVPMTFAEFIERT